MVYELVLKVEGDKSGFVTIKKRSKRLAPSVLCMLQTCKQIYDEAAAIFYSVNFISISNFQLRIFVDASSPRRLLSLKRICVCGMYTDVSSHGSKI